MPCAGSLGFFLRTAYVAMGNIIDLYNITNFVFVHSMYKLCCDHARYLVVHDPIEIPIDLSGFYL